MSKRVLVTGSSRGIGRSIAENLSKEGYEVIIHYSKDQKNAEEVLNKIIDNGKKASILKFNISDRETCCKVLNKDIETNGIYYGVICNAGIIADNPFPILSGNEWDKVIQTNLNGFYNVLQPIVMPMIQEKKGGRIITISSISGIVGNRGQINYSAAKAGIIGATKSLALELAKRKITVNCIAPGVIDTEMTKDIPREEIIKMIPMRRLGKVEEVSSLVSYLMTDAAGYITRQVISINGGLI